MTTTPMGERKKLAFTQYRHTQIAEMVPWSPDLDLDLTIVSISKPDREAGSPKAGDMIARNPKNHADMWLVAAQYFADNFELLRTPTPVIEGDGREGLVLEYARRLNDIAINCEVDNRPGDASDLRRIAEYLAALRPSPAIGGARKDEDERETCVACSIAFKEGDDILDEANGGFIHAACCGPERESYFGADGGPLKEGELIPTPFKWSAALSLPPGETDR